jgi:GMP synthase-like glutamine amidotransferase
MKIVIIDYGAGNIKSIQFAFKRLGYEAILTSDAKIIKAADKVIFPGVGEASNAMQMLKASGLDKVIPNLKQPVLGICLGSQLIAKTFGAEVYKGPIKEIGFYHDLKFSNNSKLFDGFSNPFSVFHWHGDTFDLPEGAARLALSENYQNQAFQYKSAIGLQFHLEVNEQMVNLWLDKTEEKLHEISYLDPQKIRLDLDEHISTVKSNMKIFYNNFKSEFVL